MIVMHDINGDDVDAKDEEDEAGNAAYHSSN